MNETDSRFCSGPWTGYFLDPRVGGKHKMALQLAFKEGCLSGIGSDYVGEFTLRGRYCVDGGECHWIKKYVGQHDVWYRGFNEGRGIWGTWGLDAFQVAPASGGFHIWPEGMADPSYERLMAEAPAV